MWEVLKRKRKDPNDSMELDEEQVNEGREETMNKWWFPSERVGWWLTATLPTTTSSSSSCSSSSSSSNSKNYLTARTTRVTTTASFPYTQTIPPSRYTDIGSIILLVQFCIKWTHFISPFGHFFRHFLVSLSLLSFPLTNQFPSAEGKNTSHSNRQCFPSYHFYTCFLLAPFCR